MRIMWLLNHTSARKFEINMLKQIGINEIFLAKKYPNDPNFRSASADYSEDANLTIPKEHLEILNQADWYDEVNRDTWEIANLHFDVLFCILANNAKVLKGAAKYFKGIVLLRAYGLPKITYSKLMRNYPPFQEGLAHIKTLGDRFVFGEAYKHLHLSEAKLLSSRHIYLPLGLSQTGQTTQWEGNDKKIFFVCPDIGFNNFYKIIYQKFVSDFQGFPYAIAGAQSIATDDKNILGFVTAEEHERNMRQMRVMFYHSTEPNHVHYHPFEAIRAGMPLVFMAGGLLDSFGGKTLPGRCKSIREAQQKIARILADDWQLINDIRSTQNILLDPMKAENCIDAWRAGFAKLTPKDKTTPSHKKRIAVIIPEKHRPEYFAVQNF